MTDSQITAERISVAATVNADVRITAQRISVAMSVTTIPEYIAITGLRALAVTKVTHASVLAIAPFIHVAV